MTRDSFTPCLNLANFTIKSQASVLFCHCWFGNVKSMWLANEPAVAVSTSSSWELSLTWTIVEKSTG